MEIPLAFFFTALLVWRFILVFYTPPPLRIKDKKSQALGGHVPKKQWGVKKRLKLFPLSTKGKAVVGTLLVIAAVIFSIQIFGESKEDVYAYVLLQNSKELAIRDSPNLGAEKIEFVPQYGRVKILKRDVRSDVVLERRGQWCEVEYNDFFVGYMFDGWLAYEDEVVDVVKSFISHLGRQEFDEAFSLQNFLDYETFVSTDRGYGGIRKTEIYQGPSVLERQDKPGKLSVYVRYLADDIINDRKYCSGKTGIIYQQNLYIKKENDGLVIIDADLHRRDCVDGDTIAENAGQEPEWEEFLEVDEVEKDQTTPETDRSVNPKKDNAELLRKKEDLVSGGLGGSQPNLSGIGTGSGVVGGELSGRGYEQPFELKNNSQAKGVIVVYVCVNKDGNVVSAEYTQTGSTTDNSKLKTIAIDNAKKYKFDPSDTDEQCGTIRYDFKI
ncbi:MAG: SH3 domain-containing protein [Bacteroidota bacterium]